MKRLAFTLALLITAPAITSCAPYRVYSFNLDSLVSIEIIVFDSLSVDTPDPKTTDYFSGINAGLYAYRRTGAETATGVTTFLFVPAGLLLAIVLSASPPDPYAFSPLTLPNTKSDSFVQGFRKGLNRTKARSVWNGFLKGFGLAVLIGIILTVASN